MPSRARRCRRKTEGRDRRTILPLSVRSEAAKNLGRQMASSGSKVVRPLGGNVAPAFQAHIAVARDRNVAPRVTQSAPHRRGGRLRVSPLQIPCGAVYRNVCNRCDSETGARPASGGWSLSTGRDDAHAVVSGSFRADRPATRIKGHLSTRGRRRRGCRDRVFAVIVAPIASDRSTSHSSLRLACTNCLKPYAP